MTFDHPPINTVAADTVAELTEPVDLIEREPDLNVVGFESANPHFFLAQQGGEDAVGCSHPSPAA